jgi:type IV secretion system protein VirB3
VADILERDTVFVALTRPQLLAGVTYNFFIINGILATELFLIFKSLWVIAIALIVHFVGVLL